jgi:mannose-6-phosphate isomerase-like protein (cupin superfamily)
MCTKVSHVIIRKGEVEKDCNNNEGRRILVTEIRCDSEKPIENPEWKPEFPKSTVLVTGRGGIEVSTFNQTKKDHVRHKHLICTEIYTVLEGTMAIKIGDEPEPVKLSCGDEIIVLPDTIHEVVSDEKITFLTRVHSIKCYGEADKYTEENGVWYQALTHNNLKKLIRKGKVKNGKC